MSLSKLNSVKFNFPVGRLRPTEKEVASFLVENEVNGEQVLAIYPDNGVRCIFVQFTQGEVAKKFLEKIGCETVFHYENKVAVNIQVSDANEDVRYIRCFEVPPEITDEEVAKAFAKFGQVKQVVKEKSKPLPGFEVYNGIRGVHLVMKEEVPDLVDIAGKPKRVIYPGMVEKCYRCKKVGHKRFECTASVQPRLQSVPVQNPPGNLNSRVEFPNLDQTKMDEEEAAKINREAAKTELPKDSEGSSMEEDVEDEKNSENKEELQAGESDGDQHMQDAQEPQTTTVAKKPTGNRKRKDKKKAEENASDDSVVEELAKRAKSIVKETNQLPKSNKKK